VREEAKSSASLSGDVSAGLEIDHYLNKSSHKMARKENGMKTKHRKVTNTDRSSTSIRFKMSISIAFRLIGVLALLLAAGQIATASTHG
jgi:hypothetical protein